MRCHRKTPFIPDFCKNKLSQNLFHISQTDRNNLNFDGKRVAIIGGGQTGVEIFRNALKHKWGKFNSLKLYSRRSNLEPLDETAFTNEYFSPTYVNQFWNLKQEDKDKFVRSQKLASDGNTPHYLLDLYKDLYLNTYVQNDSREIEICPMRELQNIQNHSEAYSLELKNNFTGEFENIDADLVILCTGFVSSLPKVLTPLKEKIDLDSLGRFKYNKNYTVKWSDSDTNKIYALNYSRHAHGIADPQTSLMAWRSAQIINDLSGQKIYRLPETKKPFLNYGDFKLNNLDATTGLQNEI